ncbi:GHKL domain-containing protein [Vagococcus sp. BWB3-3]|uniref:GHKL domain-containing protein n=1 Tax=Vagococcus allomyrinae TaxID=2794353 RepID=A0A940PEU2_9ENTE|nr:GHKL domain-containing protein [Vagococcus allomyrinae]MBP1043277.1 GHKL domain-containing protein [Vagococcus allomyrinae]
MSIKKALSLICVMSCGLALLWSLLTDLRYPVITITRLFLMIVLEPVVYIVVLRRYFKQGITRIYGIICMLLIFFSILDNITGTIRVTALNDLGNIAASILLLGPQCLMACLMAVVLVKKFPSFLRKVKLVSESSAIYIGSIIAYYVYTQIPPFLHFYLTDVLMWSEITSRIVLYTYNVSFYVVLIMLMTGFSNTHYQKKQLISHEMTILQQEVYVKKLESIQKEMRLLQHDYQNILTATYFTSGNSEMKDKLGASLKQADEGLVNALKEETQLTDIRIMEIRGIVLSKLLEMEKRNIEFSLVVNAPIQHCDIQITDLVRCLGILLDNAIEAVEDTPQPMIDLRLNQADDGLLIVVQNALNHTVPTDEIWQTGYSTKGENRGLGLTSYQNIVDKYQNVIKKTRIENNYFTQIMKIAS